jgi:hypothetical protein
MTYNWFEDWLDIEVIDKKEQDNEIINNNGLSDTSNTSDNSAGVLQHI